MTDPTQTPGSSPTPPAGRPLDWLDRQALAYSEWMFWVHLIICQCPGIVVGLLFLIACATPEGKAVGGRLLKFSLMGVLVGVLLRALITVFGS